MSDVIFFDGADALSEKVAHLLIKNNINTKTYTIERTKTDFDFPMLFLKHGTLTNKEIENHLNEGEEHFIKVIKTLIL